MNKRCGRRWLMAVLAGLLLGVPAGVEAAREAKAPEGAEAGGADFEARRLLEKAEELLAAGEAERGVRMLETVIEQYPTGRMRFGACLALGRHYVKAHEQPKAIGWLTNLKQLEGPDGVVKAADRDVYLEGMFLLGSAYFQVRNYAAAFPILRKITSNYPNTSWANQSYYYIGMCHFAQQNWSKAIEALNLVGTFIDLDAGGSTELAEAGRRFYVKVRDLDMPVLLRQGKQAQVELESSHGDRERVNVIPLGNEGDLLIGSMPTEVAVAKPGDGVLQVLGGATVTARYTDANSQDGSAGVVRQAKVRVVSSGSVAFTLGDYTTMAVAAYQEQPLNIVLNDADLDTTDGADSASVKLVVRYRKAQEEEEVFGRSNTVDLQKILNAATQDVYEVRDELEVRLTEMAAAPAAEAASTGAVATASGPVRSGRFVGSVLVKAATDEAPADPKDVVLSCAVDDEVVVAYVDSLHLGGDTPRRSQATVKAAGKIENRPVASQDVVSDAGIKARKYLVEATAYLELARIFKGMGLSKGATQKAVDGLERVDFVIRTSIPIPGELRQQGFKTKWELHLAADDFESAMATCSAFNNLYPNSPLVDEALMGIAKVHLDQKRYADALAVLQAILALPQSQAKAEAQFRIAEIAELGSKDAVKSEDGARAREAAVQQYKVCAERYPDSEFAGQSLAKLVDYHVDMNDYAQANELLAQIFTDHPDAGFLDSMLLKWVLVAYRAGDHAKAREKCQQLLFEYPDSAYAEKAKQILPRIEAKLSTASAPAATEGEKTP